MVAAQVVVVFGCAVGDGTGVEPPPSPPTPPNTISLAVHVQPIFTKSCAFSACHAGPNPQEAMDLSVGQSYGNIVGFPSNQVPRLSRLTPGDPDSSYIVLKLEGTAGGVGGLGTRMPLGGALTSQQIDTVRAWIAAGAPNN